ncbi:YesL family protein [Alkalicoccus halolimnae]|uniref:DUF624 domain-containing protein n=1 Tax=Alkalicoccus halolimnae TaxID=1667239 RepID=A0A5C7FB35_9BACI|nr:DUF624 domain-containing protein [Alkalicoccus halolimnae]TXF83607.1 DUF624 domain-containing protein [Alkalicoccus halolimnae]
MNGFHRFFDWTAKFAVLNVLWLIASIPVLLLAAMVLTGRAGGMEVELFVASSLLLPLFFFPATAALFRSVRDLVMEREPRSVAKQFIMHLAKGYGQSAAGGAVFTFIWLIWVVDYYYFYGVNVLFQFVFLGLAVPLVLMTIYFFILQAHYDVRLKVLFKKAFILTFGNVRLSLMIFGASFLIFYVSVNSLVFLLLFFSGSITAFLVFSFFYKYYTTVSAAGAS